MHKFLIYFNTIIKLGVLNVTYVFYYRLSLKTGLRKLFFKPKKFEFSSDFYKSTKLKTDYPDSWKHELIVDANRIINGEIRYYAYHWKHVGNSPNWFLNPFNGITYPNSNLHWTILPDFNAKVGDIKNIWEASRFEWVVTLSRAYAVSGNPVYLETLNNWIKDWTEKNPLNTGPNWKCGQEAAIRIFNLINATQVLGLKDDISGNLSDLIYSHLERINGNIYYAIAQDNNHGISEAAGLFIGGIFLSDIDSKRYPKATKYIKKGRSWLENRVSKLIEKDGSFSQHSVNYHRVMLDTLCFAEFWRSKLKVPPFSDNFYQKAKSATNWLYLMTDAQTGNAPNLGSNDGAMLLNLHSCNYRNFRPTMQLVSSLFDCSYDIKSDHSEEVLYWFGIIKEKNKKQNLSKSITLKSGYTIIHSQNSWAMVRWPFFRFRPSHNDVMHFDLWFNGQNVICDSGTYSYNPPEEDAQLDFKSVHFHNTVTFENQEQMPKLSRFLFGNWLKADQISQVGKNSEGVQEWQGSYHSNTEIQHIRRVSVNKDFWEITDTLKGNFKEAYIGFNIADQNCKLINGELKTNFGKIIISKDTTPLLVKSYSSIYYWEKHLLKRLKIKVTKPGTYNTIIELI